ncbi:hypothetical protein BOX15_Mlig002101g10, partial [Macrostomum lignano]
ADFSSLLTEIDHYLGCSGKQQDSGASNNELVLSHRIDHFLGLHPSQLELESVVTRDCLEALLELLVTGRSGVSHSVRRRCVKLLTHLASSRAWQETLLESHSCLDRLPVFFHQRPSHPLLTDGLCLLQALCFDYHFGAWTDGDRAAAVASVVSVLLFYLRNDSDMAIYEPSLGILASLLRGNTDCQNLVRNSDKFHWLKKQLLKNLENPSLSITIYSMSLIYYLGGCGEQLFNCPTNSYQSIQAVFHVLLTGSCNSRWAPLYSANLLIDIATSGFNQDLLPTYEYLPVCLGPLLDQLTAEKLLQGKILEVLHVLCNHERSRKLVFDQILLNSALQSDTTDAKLKNSNLAFVAILSAAQDSCDSAVKAVRLLTDLYKHYVDSQCQSKHRLELVLNYLLPQLSVDSLQFNQHVTEAFERNVVRLGAYCKLLGYLCNQPQWCDLIGRQLVTERCLDLLDWLASKCCYVGRSQDYRRRSWIYFGQVCSIRLLWLLCRISNFGVNSNKPLANQIEARLSTDTTETSSNGEHRKQSSTSCSLARLLACGLVYHCYSGGPYSNASNGGSGAAVSDYCGDQIVECALRIVCLAGQKLIPSVSRELASLLSQRHRLALASANNSIASGPSALPSNGCYAGSIGLGVELINGHGVAVGSTTSTSASAGSSGGGGGAVNGGHELGSGQLDQLINDVKNRLNLKDTRVSDLLTLYESKLQACQLSEESLIAYAAAQSDALSRCQAVARRQAQRSAALEAECAKLRGATADAEKAQEALRVLEREKAANEARLVKEVKSAQRNAERLQALLDQTEREKLEMAERNNQLKNILMSASAVFKS